MEQNDSRLIEVWPVVGPQTANVVPVLTRLPGIWTEKRRTDLGSPSSSFRITEPCHSGSITPFGPSVREMPDDTSQSKTISLARG